MHGVSLRIGYSKFIDPTDTSITVAAYRYSTAGYMSFSDAAALRDAARHGGDVNAIDRERGRVQLTLNQNLNRYGSVFVTASTQRYWNRSGSDSFFQAGYSNSFKFGTYTITAGRTRNANGSMSNELMLSMTIPLGRTPHAPLLTTNLSNSGDASNLQANLSGTLGSDDQLSYNVYDTYAKNAGAGSGNAGVSGMYRAPVTQVTASASAGAHSAQVSAGVSGSIVAHPGGVTFSQTVGDTFAVVEAKGAEGAHVTSAQGVTINRSGYAVVPYLTPYGINTVDLDTKGTSTDVEFESTSERAVPRFGSVVMLRYKTVTGRAALIQAPRVAGDALPFGAEVVDQNGRNVGVVAQDSRIFARGLEDTGTLTVKWGDEPAQQCTVDYALPKASGEADAPYLSVQAHCVAAAVPQAAPDQAPVPRN
jgi:outer membrane usher protein